jgi:hypothetical protein
MHPYIHTYIHTNFNRHLHGCNAHLLGAEDDTPGVDVEGKTGGEDQRAAQPIRRHYRRNAPQIHTLLLHCGDPQVGVDLSILRAIVPLAAHVLRVSVHAWRCFCGAGSGGWGRGGLMVLMRIEEVHAPCLDIPSCPRWFLRVQYRRTTFRM